MTLGEFKKWTKGLPDSAYVGYHAYDKGCALGTFDKEKDCWIYRKGANCFIVMNPGNDYDPRKAVQK